MKLKLAVAALALVIATPTFAAEYYIIQSASNKKCTVASKKPTSDKATLVGDGTAYKTKKEARTALKAADACKAAWARNPRTLSKDVRPLMAHVLLPWL